MFAQRVVGRGLSAGALLVTLMPAVAGAVTCPDFTAKRLEQFRKSAASNAGRCLKRSIRTGVACPDARLSDALAAKRARIVKAADRRCPGSGIDGALLAAQSDAFCQVLAVCPSLPLGEITQRLVANSTLDEPPAPRDLTIDIGWQGLLHRQRLLEGAQFTAELSNCDGETDTLCDLSGATTGLPFGPPSPVLAGGIGVCILLDFASDVTGTIDVATGEVTEQATLHGTFYNYADEEHPCPICVPADGEPDLGESGTCAGGPSDGMPCTIQGLTRPVFAGVSHDCLPNPLSLAGEFTTQIAPTTGTTSLGVSAASPRCTGTGFAGQSCPCDTCNNAAAEPCSSNADCPMSGGAAGICGGRRCIGGPNAGFPCTVNSICGAGSICNRPGQPTQPNTCYDQVCTPTADGYGICADGPNLTMCALETWRFCASDDDCPRSGDSCEAHPASCFVDPITATGTPDVPANAEAHPTLVGTFCMGPTFMVSVNYSAGLPGPVRFVWPAKLTFGE